MSTRIQHVVPMTMRLTPAEAELWFSVHPQRVTSATQVRGRLTGPSCPYASTVEVAYPLREHSREYGKDGQPHITVRALIPDPNWWDPVSPFLYQGALELWQGDECCEKWPVRHGFRVFALTPQGPRCNDRRLTVRGVRRERLTEDEARRLHAEGVNTLLAPVNDGAAELWATADRFGFLMLGRVTSKEDIRRAFPLSGLTSCLGWLLTADLLDDPLVRAALPFPGGDVSRPGAGGLVGVELVGAPTQPLPPAVSFVACTEEALPRCEGPGRPIILLTGRAPVERPGMLGFIGTGDQTA